MTAGLPGIGLGGLFFIVSGLIMPFVHVVRLARGTTRAGDTRLVLRQAALAGGMVLGAERFLALLGSVTGASSAGLLPAPPVLISTVVLMGLLGAVALGGRVLARREPDAGASVVEWTDADAADLDGEPPKRGLAGRREGGSLSRREGPPDGTRSKRLDPHV